ncbi:MAG: c-type cytochrome [Terriglobia bacterium]
MKRIGAGYLIALFVLSLLGLARAAAAGQERARKHTAAPPQSEAVKRGRSQFLKTCAFCHGPEGNGGSEGPDLMRSAVVRHDENGNLIGELIRDGRPDKGMPAFQLSAGQIADVVAFLHDRLAEVDRRSPRRPGAGYSLAKLLVGNAAAGKKYFYGAGGCERCHSPRGDLAGIATKIPAADLQARFLYPRGMQRKATVIDSSGKRYTGVVRLLTNYDIALQDSAGWYHSWPLDSVKVRLQDPLAAHRHLISKITDAEMHDMLAYLETLK